METVLCPQCHRTNSGTSTPYHCQYCGHSLSGVPRLASREQATPNAPTMDEKRVQDLVGWLRAKSTDELLKLYEKGEHSAASFEAFKRLMTERNVPIPAQTPYRGTLYSVTCPKCGKRDTGTTPRYYCQYCGQSLSYVPSKRSKLILPTLSRLAEHFLV